MAVRIVFKRQFYLLKIINNHKQNGDLWVEGIYQVTHFRSTLQFPQRRVFGLMCIVLRDSESPHLILSGVNISLRRPG